MQRGVVTLRRWRRATEVLEGGVVPQIWQRTDRTLHRMHAILIRVVMRVVARVCFRFVAVGAVGLQICHRLPVNLLKRLVPAFDV